jgi:NADPH2:quinone reductase
VKPRGYVVLYGQSSGAVEPLDPQKLNQKGSLFLTRPSLGHYVADGDEFSSRATEVLDLIRSGELQAVVGDQLPLAEAEQAHRRLEGRLTVGKVVLMV